jgi:hypothetical protein
MKINKYKNINNYLMFLCLLFTVTMEKVLVNICDKIHRSSAVLVTALLKEGCSGVITI